MAKIILVKLQKTRQKADQVKAYNKKVKATEDKNSFQNIKKQ